jgi:hypothetical protein
MKYLVFTGVKEAVRYRRAIGDTISKFCINELGFRFKKTKYGLHPLGKRKRDLVNDPYFKRTGKQRKNVASFRWKPPISLMCSKSKEGQFLYLIEDFRPFLVKLLLENNRGIPNKVIHKYFKRFLTIPTQEFESIELYANSTFDIQELNKLKEWVESRTSYKLDEVDVSKVAVYAPYSDLNYLMDYIDNNLHFLNYVIEVIEHDS